MTNCRAIVSFPKTCQQCGVEFACGGSCCWCDEIALEAEVRRELREQFSDCLCRSCLEQARERSRHNTPLPVSSTGNARSIEDETKQAE